MEKFLYKHAKGTFVIDWIGTHRDYYERNKRR